MRCLKRHWQISHVTGYNFSGNYLTLLERMGTAVKALISNPLIVACIAGIIYSKTISTFPVFLEKTFRLFTSVTLPLALLSIGSALTPLQI